MFKMNRIQVSYTSLKSYVYDFLHSIFNLLMNDRKRRHLCGKTKQKSKKKKYLQNVYVNNYIKNKSNRVVLVLIVILLIVLLLLSSDSSDSFLFSDPCLTQFWSKMAVILVIGSHIVIYFSKSKQ